MKLETLKNKFHSWLLMDDDRVIDVMLATVLANRWTGDSVNVHIIGPPSSMKTELLRSLFDLPDVYEVGSLTAHCLTSGFVDDNKKQKSRDHSVLSKIAKQNKTLLVIKEFTTLLEKRAEDKSEILSQLREIADGRFTADYGSGQAKIMWQGRVGVLTGVTHVIDKQLTLRQMLGERFLHYRLPKMEGEGVDEIARRALKNTGKEERMRSQLSKGVCEFMSQFTETKIHDISAGVVTEGMLINLSKVVAKGRTGISRDRASQGLNYIPECEAPARVAKQLQKIGKAIAAVQGKTRTDFEVYRILKKIGRDTMPSYRNLLLKTLWIYYPVWKTIEFLALQTQSTAATMRLHISDLVELKAVSVAEQKGEVGRPESVYRLAEETYEELRMSQIY